MYDRPANVFVAGFLGSPAMNLLELPIEDGGVRSATSSCGAARTSWPRPRGPTVSSASDRRNLEVSDAGVPMRVEIVEELGADAWMYGTAQLGADSPMLVGPRRLAATAAEGPDLHLAPADTREHPPVLGDHGLPPRLVVLVVLVVGTRGQGAVSTAWLQRRAPRRRRAGPSAAARRGAVPVAGAASTARPEST